MREPEAEAIVVGGGLVGSAIAYGLARAGRRVLIIDEGDVALRASRGNFALVWVQGKGAGMPDYARWTRRSADAWPELAADLHEQTGIDVQLAQPGGLYFCFSEAELAERAELMHRMANIIGPDFRYEVIERPALERMVPRLGPAVAGALYSPHDGHANSLRLLQALQAGAQALGATYRPEGPVTAIRHEAPGFRVETATRSFAAERIVLAAGNGTPALARMVGLSVPLRPQRGQILVTAKVAPFLAYPTHILRQTAEGGVMLGDSKEEVGIDERTTPRAARAIAANAVATFPFLTRVPVVRSWAALRVMTPDGHPIYQESAACPGAFVACVHSGVTLAAAHAGPLAAAIAEGRLPEELEGFDAARFDVHAAA